ncbi:MAG: hypothetical protein K8S16_13985 [Bacteroidales bacterium]|nr:hypothetical protein [Bacteroidales bacterium]
MQNYTENNHYANHLGFACLELDENADIISYEEYHPFGTTSYRSGRTETEVSLKRYKYVGKERDEETGLYYYGARYYAAWLCRFVSVDPLAGERSWVSPYNYVQNNPLNRIDPTGALDDDPPKGMNPELNQEDSDVIKSNDGSKLEKNPTVPDEPEPYKFQVSLKQLKEYFPNANSDVLKDLEKHLNEYMDNFGIDNNNTLAHFLSQAGHETGGFKKSSVTESLYYKTEDRLKEIYPSYFGDNKGNKASDYLKNSKKLANLVYADRLGNSDTESGEGYKYRGRGIFQLTGKYNYEQFSSFYKDQFDSKTDLVKNPGSVASNSKIATISALWFFQKNVIDKIDMSKATVDKVTKKINPAKAGINDRISIYNRIVKIQKNNGK